MNLVLAVLLTLGSIQGRIYGAQPEHSHGVLFVVLHGDSPFEDPSYQYVFAERVARTIPGAIAAALLRPGYADGLGARSQGVRGNATGDNYTPEDVDAIGGAAIAADILARHPSTARDAFLIGCPCDVLAWRSCMMHKQLAPIWARPVRSLSPISLVGT